ncbi:hypothetical protein ANANG_G00307320 [Anguilla anguilla]|uniref:Uncharacterized protein n=1 Tax=Anguilla anguilla TaxID=7936 RepID=A0A9D3LKH8_ANGAN|nr:hypothetical protein ANANG_G00307320 [Anguilla anguilla]
MNMPLHQISVIPRDVTSSRGSASGKAKEKDREKQVGHGRLPRPSRWRWALITCSVLTVLRTGGAECCFLAVPHMIPMVLFDLFRDPSLVGYHGHILTFA